QRGRLDALVLVLAAGLLEVAPALEVGMLELVLGRLIGRRGLDQLGADARDAFTDLVVGQRLELGLEGIDLVDERLDPTELTVVGIEETGEDAHGSQEYRVGAPRSRSGTEGRRGVRRCDRARRAMARAPAAALG